MDPNGKNLNEIATIWTQVILATTGGRAVGGADTICRSAQQQLMERYSGAVYRYLLGALRDRHAADDLFQEFCLRFLRGDFRNAHPQKGRFRDFVKTALFHLIVDHQNRRKSGPVALPVEEYDIATTQSELRCSDQEFLESWRNEILSRTWQALDVAGREADQQYYRVLRFRAEHPEMSSAQMAERLSVEMGRPVKPDWVRQTLKRARDKFTEILLDELSRSMDNPTRERLEQELTDLGLLSYCQGALEQRR
jgi:RNA polymerase sigma-70 factor (ECF subfamily)